MFYISYFLGMLPIFIKPVPDHKGRNVTPPDFRKVRQIALCKELLKPKYQVDGFKTANLQQALPDYFRNSAQIRYEIRKLIVRGIIVKQKKMSFYTVTPKGWKWLWLAISSTSFFRNPMISKGFKNEFFQASEQPSKIEEAYQLIDHGLSQIKQELAIAA